MSRTFVRILASTAILGVVGCASGPAFASTSATNTVPTVSMVSPASGPINGGTAITVTGTGFVAGAQVEIGQGAGAAPIMATSVQVVSATEITAVTGGGAKVGLFHLHVVTAGGTSTDLMGNRFTYLGPVVAAVSPNSGPLAGGTAITVTGTGFLTSAKVEIAQGNGSPIMATNVHVVSATKITATTGRGVKVGTFHVRVVTTQGTSAENPGDRFTYN
jgi:hypothetical protein